MGTRLEDAQSSDTLSTIETYLKLYCNLGSTFIFFNTLIFAVLNYILKFIPLVFILSKMAQKGGAAQTGPSGSRKNMNAVEVSLIPCSSNRLTLNG